MNIAKVTKNELLREVKRNEMLINSMDNERKILRAKVQLHQAQVQAANLYIAYLAAKAVGLEVPCKGIVKIKKDVLASILKSQKVTWHESEDKKEIILNCEIVEDSDDKDNFRHEAGSEGNNDTQTNENSTNGVQ